MTWQDPGRGEPASGSSSDVPPPSAWGQPQPQEPPAGGAGWGAPVAWTPPPPAGPQGRGIDGLVGDSWRVVRRGLAPLIGLSAIQFLGVVAFLPALAVAGPWLADAADLLAQAQSSGDPAIAEQLGQRLGLPPSEAILPFIIGVIIAAVISGAVTLGIIAMAADILAERPVAIGRAFRIGLNRLPAFIGLNLVIGLVVALSVAALVALTAALGGFALILWPVAVVAMIFFGIRLIPMITVLVLEEKGPLGSIGRAMFLTERRVLMTLGFSVIVWLLGLIVGQAMSILFSAVAPSFSVLGFLLSSLSSLLILPWTAATSVVLYDELRRRSTPSWLGSQASATAAPPPTIDPSGWR